MSALKIVNIWGNMSFKIIEKYAQIWLKSGHFAPQRCSFSQKIGKIIQNKELFHCRTVTRKDINSMKTP
jgi:hypothetical protein